MTEEALRILEAALKLSADERADMILVLEDSLGDGSSTPEEIEAAWIAECRRRLEAVESGLEEPIPAEVVDAELEEIIAQASARRRLAG